MDHRCWDLGSHGGFMGRIWCPGDHISAALYHISRNPNKAPTLYMFSTALQFFPVIMDYGPPDPPVASFTKEVNPRLAKRPLIFNGRLANCGLNSLVKEATDVWARPGRQGWANRQQPGYHNELCHRILMKKGKQRKSCLLVWIAMAETMHPLRARFMGPTWGPSGADRTQVGLMLAPWTVLSGHHFTH